MSTYREALAHCESRAARQLGLISLDQCMEEGLSERAAQRLVRRNDWKRFLPRVYMPRPVPDSWWTSAKGATLWGGRGCVLCGRAAARARSLSGYDQAGVEIAAPTDRRTKLLVVHHYPALPLGPVDVVRSIPLIPPESMAFELCRIQSYSRARRTVGEMVRSEMTSDVRLKAFVEEIGGRGVKGTCWIRAILDERLGVERAAETDAEIEFARIAAGWKLHPIPQYRLRIGARIVRRFDFAFPASKIGVEIDGGIHDDVGIVIEDREKDELARAHGWVVLRFTDRDIWYRPGYVRESLLEALTSTAPTASLG